MKHDSTKNFVENAMRVACKGHRNQMRKDDTLLPYISHPAMVALLLTKHGFTDDVIAAALTHDILEDTDVPPEELEEQIGASAFAIVQGVTNETGVSWREKKERYIALVRSGDEGVKAVATADKIHNAQSLLRAHAEAGAEVWKLFNAGKEEKLWFERAVLTMLQETWDHPLVQEYALLVDQLEALD